MRIRKKRKTNVKTSWTRKVHDLVLFAGFNGQCDGATAHDATATAAHATAGLSTTIYAG